MSRGSAWPLVAGLGPLGALPTAPRLARSFTAVVLGGWELAELAEDAELIASELCSNVVRAASGPDGRPRYDGDGRLPLLWLRLLSDGAQLRIEAWDTAAAELGVPTPRRAAADEESGRGLHLVSQLSLDWGWDYLPGHDRPGRDLPGHAAKRVWALLKGSR
jgi:anti-sigma regulatory factor (Ser/Thr protein kinase)